MGNFSVDLVAEDGAGRLVVIENQFERTDHDHPGKLLTDIVNVEAKTADWITSDPGPEHAAVIAWLNETAAADFYLVELEAVRISESVPAPLFTLVAGPSEEARDAGSVKKNLAERHDLRERFWSGFIPSAAKRTNLHRDCSATGLDWIGARIGWEWFGGAEPAARSRVTWMFPAARLPNPRDRARRGGIR